MDEYPPVTAAYFGRDARALARALVGAYLVHDEASGRKVARIVETEAYRGPKDLACHARFGLTRRTRSLLGPPGHAYVFMIYGMHQCFNVVGLRAGAGHAVLVRAGEPVVGLPDGARCEGPGRFARALGITRDDDGRPLSTRPLYVSARRGKVRIGVSARVGVGYAGAFAEAPWRFFDRDSDNVSRPSRRFIGLGLQA